LHCHPPYGFQKRRCSLSSAFLALATTEYVFAASKPNDLEHRTSRKRIGRERSLI
jgi:hypothetical protein